MGEVSLLWGDKFIQHFDRETSWKVATPKNKKEMEG
jgi:hypothetical protein